MNVENPIQTRAAVRAGSTWNAEAWSFEVVLSAGTGVTRQDARGSYLEMLSLAQAWPERVPLLDGHKRASLDDRLGYVDSIRVVGSELRGRGVLSRHNPMSQRIAAEFSDGNFPDVSIGYVVKSWSERTNPETGSREKVAVSFDLLEASLVVIPADPAARVRSTPLDPTAIQTPTPAPAAAPPAAPIIAERAAINVQIRSIAQVASLPQSWTDAQIDAGASVEAARAAAFAEMQTRLAPASGVRTATIVADHTDPEFRARAMGEALYTRANPAHTPSDAARPYIGLTISELARDCLRTRGHSSAGLAADGVITRALQTTADFPLLLADSVGRTLREAYGAAPAGVKRLGRQTTAKDFRAKHRIQFSAAPTLEPVNEHGEFKAGAMAEAQESYSISTFGRIIGMTRQALVNDDLGAFADLSRRLGIAAAQFEAAFLVKLLLSNPQMADGKALFHADHGNLAVAGTRITQDALSAARLAMRRQAGLQNELISVTPKYLLVGADRETEAEKAVTAVQATKVGDGNAFAFLGVVVDPRIDDGSWHVVADPAEIDGLEYAYLEGESGPQLSTELGFAVDGMRIRVRLDFGGGFVDHRGWYRNTGA